MAESSAQTRPWQLSWWSPNLRKEDRQDCCQRVAEASDPRPPYYILIVLSTLIAAYGLVSNSTATVIGAMIVAPLMGPILGLALGTVLGDVRMFRRALIAETSGMVLVILTGILVAVMVGTNHIEYSGGEIVARIRPTLFDFAIGLAAGLAGAYCTVHPGLQGGVAGVAIAVALVPPLAVTGLCTAGWMTGEVEFRSVFGSFMLFFTNLLTIELASGLVFWITGFRLTKEGRENAVFRKTLVVKAVLLLLTGWFLTNQLTNLLRERYGLDSSRRLLQKMLRDIPGADLDSIEVNLDGRELLVRAVVGSRTNIEPRTVAQFQRRLNQELKNGLPQAQVRLVVRTVNSTYASSTGYLFEPTKSVLDKEEERTQALDETLRELLGRYPGVELLSFSRAPRENSSSGAVSLTLTLSSAYDFSPRLVRDLEQELNEALSQDPLFAGHEYRLLVKSLLTRSYNSQTSVAVEAPLMSTEQEQTIARQDGRLRELLLSALELNSGFKVTELHLRRLVTPSKGAGPDDSVPPAQDREVSFEAQITLRSPRLIRSELLLESRDKAQAAFLDETGVNAKVNIHVVWSLGEEMYLADTDTSVNKLPSTDEDQTEERHRQISSDLRRLVSAVPGAFLDGDAVIRSVAPGEVNLVATVISPRLLENRSVIEWQKRLLKLNPELRRLQLTVENHLGRSVKTTPLSQP